MRIALISDIHANEVAMKAVIDDINQSGIDQIICLGDVATLGPMPESIIRILQELKCPCILGNHDAFLLEPDLIRTYTEASEIVDAVDWCRNQLSDEALDFIHTFLPSIEISPDSHSTILLFHGSPRSNMDDILATTPPDDLDQLLGEKRTTVMAGGHTHIQMLRQHRGTLIVNPGSVGLPFREYAMGQAPTLLGHAEYTIVEAINGSINVNLRRIALDLTALRAAAAASDNPLSGMLLQQYSQLVNSME